MEKNHILELFNVSKTFGQKTDHQKVLAAANFRFEQGKTYALIGASGSGKSTLLHLLGGLDQPTAGQVLFDGISIQDMNKQKKESFLRTHIGFMFQNHFLIKELSVLDNVMLPALLQGTSPTNAAEQAHELLKIVGLDNRHSAFPAQLSGGQAQRVAFARAVINKPSFILADEPTGNLDAVSAHEVINLLCQAPTLWGSGVIVCSHDPALYDRMDQVLRVADQTVSHLTHPTTQHA